MWGRLFILVVGVILGFFLRDKMKDEGDELEKETTLKKSVVFEFENKDAKKVVLTGDFNNWDVSSDQMFDLGDGLWSITMYLEPGRYEYKFVVDDNVWVADPKAKEFVDDGYGGKRSVIVVK
jgi:1,4-alpha-glucan branching enzyme